MALAEVTIPEWTMGDPVGRFHQRFFDGAQWTQHVTDVAGVQQVDPGPINTI